MPQQVTLPEPDEEEARSASESEGQASHGLKVFQSIGKARSSANAALHHASKAGQGAVQSTANAALHHASRAGSRLEKRLMQDFSKIEEQESDRLTQRTLITQFSAFLVAALRHYCLDPSEAENDEHKERILMAKLNFSSVHAHDLVELVLLVVKVKFRLTGAEGEHLNGQWRTAGRTDDRPRFVRVLGGLHAIEWNASAKEWRLGVERRGEMSDEDVLYRIRDPLEEQDLPLTGWEAVHGEGPAPATRAESELNFFDVFDAAWAEDPPKLQDAVLTEDVAHPHWCQVRGPYGDSVLTWLWHLRSRASSGAEDYHKLEGRAARSEHRGHEAARKERRHEHDAGHRALEGLYSSAIKGILSAEPGLAGVMLHKEPYCGETILHQACAAGDTLLASWLVTEPQITSQPFFKDQLLMAPMGGKFLKSILKVPVFMEGLLESGKPPDSDAGKRGATPLEVALLAPYDDHNSEELVKILIKAGAAPVFRDSQSGKVLFNLLHVIAASSWEDSWKEPPLMSEARTKAMVALFLDPHRECYHIGKNMASMPNAKHYTPLQVAAMFGNRDCFVEMLDHMKVPVWDWGTKKEVGFPLVELDSGARDSEICALELMTLYKHGSLLSLGLMSDIINKKWELYGRTWVHRYVAMQLVCCFCTAMVCLDDTEGWSQWRWISRHVVLLIASVFLVATAALYVLCARDEAWFHHMGKVPHGSGYSISVWDLLSVRNCIEMLMMIILVITPPWYAEPELRANSTYNFLWHSFASAWFLMFVVFSLRYFELFEATSAMASTLPQVMRRDMIPFGSFYFVILICCSVAMRVSVEMQDKKHDETSAFGTFWKTLKSLEEAIHGPDVQWRGAVEDHPRVSGFVFVLFLWITLVMMSVVIAMFGNTWETVKQHTHQRFLWRRAMFCITQEKLFPQWYHNHPMWGSGGCNIGVPLGCKQAKAVVDDPNSSDEELNSARPLQVEETTPLLLGVAGGAAASGSSYKAVTDSARERARADLKRMLEQNREEDRWLLWHGGETTFDNWKRDSQHARREHL